MLSGVLIRFDGTLFRACVTSAFRFKDLVLLSEPHLTTVSVGVKLSRLNRVGRPVSDGGRRLEQTLAVSGHSSRSMDVAPFDNSRSPAAGLVSDSRDAMLSPRL